MYLSERWWYWAVVRGVGDVGCVAVVVVAGRFCVVEGRDEAGDRLVDAR